MRKTSSIILRLPKTAVPIDAAAARYDPMSDAAWQGETSHQGTFGAKLVWRQTPPSQARSGAQNAIGAVTAPTGNAERRGNSKAMSSGRAR
jgi:hypothetical protein